MANRKIKTPEQLEKLRVFVPSVGRASISEKREMVKKYARIANRRIKRLQEAKNISPMDSGAYKIIIAPKIRDGEKYFTQSGMFSLAVKGKNEIDLEEELDILRRFLKAKTSTIEGARYANDRALNASIKALNEKGNQQLASMIEEAKETRTARELGDWFRENSLWKLVSIFGSEVAINIKEDIEKEVSAFEENNENSIIHKDDSAINDLINKFIDEHSGEYTRNTPQIDFIDDVVEYITHEYNLSDSEDSDSDKEIIIRR